MKKETKIEIKYYEDGPVFSIKEYADRYIYHGLHIFFFKNGRTMRQTQYKNDECDGAYINWHRNGTMDKHCFFVSGKLEGEQISNMGVLTLS